MDNLHWSVDYSHQTTKRDFRGEFSQILAGALSSPPLDLDAKTRIHRYTLLPNFWSGAKPDSPDDPSLKIGHASVERTRDDRGVWQYRVEHVNTISGEELALDFACDDVPARPLRDTWKISTRNSADGSYSSISWTGTCRHTDGVRTVVLTTERGLDVAAGSPAPDATLTCNWALFDVLAALDDGNLDGLAILEDLDTLKETCRIRPLDKWTFQTGGERHVLSGYCVFGVGLPPSYWWLAETGDVAVVSTMLATYVLTERNA